MLSASLLPTATEVRTDNNSKGERRDSFNCWQAVRHIPQQPTLTAKAHAHLKPLKQ
jgi:hypothetical protein